MRPPPPRLDRGGRRSPDNVEKAAGSPKAGRAGGRVVARRTAVEGDPSSEVSSLPTPEGPASPPSEASYPPASTRRRRGGGEGRRERRRQPRRRWPSAGGACRQAAVDGGSSLSDGPDARCRGGAGGGGADAGSSCRAAPSFASRRRSGAIRRGAAVEYGVDAAGSRRWLSFTRRTSSRPSGMRGAARRTSTMATRRRRRRPRSPGSASDPPRGVAAPSPCISGLRTPASDRGPQQSAQGLAQFSRPAPPAAQPPCTALYDLCPEKRPLEATIRLLTPIYETPRARAAGRRRSAAFAGRTRCGRQPGVESSDAARSSWRLANSIAERLPANSRS